MSNKKLAMLAVAAVVMVIWAVVQSNISSGPVKKSDVPTYLIQGLDPAEIAGIVISSGDNTVTLKRQQDRFVVANKNNYPADLSQINRLIASCLDFKTAELYTEDKANHKDLGVTEENAANVVKFLKHDSSTLTGIVIGTEREQGQGRYVRLVSDDKVYVTFDYPWINNEVMNYIDQELVSVDFKGIESVSVTGPNEAYTLKSADVNNTTILLEDIPEDKKLKISDAKRVFSALTSVRFDDVKKLSDKEELNFDRQFVCRLKDSSIYTINIAQKDDKTYVTCNAEFTDTSQVTKERAVETIEELKKKEAKLLARDKAQQFSAKHKNWLYQIPEHKAKQLIKKLSELLEEKSESEQQKEPAAPDSQKT